MCGIVGLFLKEKKLEGHLGSYLSDMLIEMTERGPDSVGFAIYDQPTIGKQIKCTLLNTLVDSGEELNWDEVRQALKKQFGNDTKFEEKGSHALISVETDTNTLNEWLNENFPHINVNGSGRVIEIYKEKGLPKDVIASFNLQSFTGSHALGHTRMATESAVTTGHSHPFSTGDDICLVHNGSLSNHNRWREKLRKEGIVISTDNDSEVAAAYFNWRLKQGDDLNTALTKALDDLDGFYTFAIGTKDGFAVMRDNIGCKPAVIAETDQWVAMASEFRAIAMLPGVENASIWEPEPGKIYSWHKAA
jgi:glutamate synthase domain-containing protein 1